MRVIGRLLRYALRHRGAIAGAGLLTILNAAVELARPWPIKLLIDYVLPGRALPWGMEAAARALPGGAAASGRLTWLVVLALVVVVAAGALALAAKSVIIVVAQRLVSDLSRDVFARMQRLSLTFHGRHKVGDLMQRMGADVFAVHAVVAQVALPGVVSTLMLVGMFTVLLHLDATLALVAGSVVPLLALALAAFARPMQRTTQMQWKRQGQLMALLEQTLSGIKVVQGFAREAYVQRQLDARAGDLARAFSAATRVGSGYTQLTALVTGAATAVVLGVGGARVLAGRLTVGDLFVFLTYLAALYAPVTALTAAVGGAIQVTSRGRRVFAVLDSTEELPERPGARALGRARGEVAFEDVTFGYEYADARANADATPGVAARRVVLRDVSLHIAPGQTVAVVGPTGAGKTSLVALLSRLYDPWAGRVLVDGHDVRDLTIASLRENVALVLQESFLFPMSVADNIAFGRPDATRAEIEAAARAAHADAFVRRLPEGYDTLVGEKGSTLSGGERQRIAIARAVLKDAPVLVLDEPTAALDAETEAQIFAALGALMRGRTTFIVSHRLTTIRRADVILAVEDGRVVESGTHEELVDQGGLYARLHAHHQLVAY